MPARPLSWASPTSWSRYSPAATLRFRCSNPPQDLYAQCHPPPLCWSCWLCKCATRPRAGFRMAGAWTGSRSGSGLQRRRSCHTPSFRLRLTPRARGPPLACASQASCVDVAWCQSHQTPFAISPGSKPCARSSVNTRETGSLNRSRPERASLEGYDATSDANTTLSPVHDPGGRSHRRWRVRYGAFRCRRRPGGRRRQAGQRAGGV